MLDGTIENVMRDRGFGFVRGTDGVKRFFHASGVVGIRTFAELEVGDNVAFAEEPSDRGPRAVNVRATD